MNLNYSAEFIKQEIELKFTVLAIYRYQVPSSMNHVIGENVIKFTDHLLIGIKSGSSVFQTAKKMTAAE